MWLMLPVVVAWGAGLVAGSLITAVAAMRHYKARELELEAGHQRLLQPQELSGDGPYRHTCAGALAHDSIAIAACEMRSVVQQQKINVLQDEVELLRFCRAEGHAGCPSGGNSVTDVWK
jgi:hypothetical protein